MRELVFIAEAFDDLRSARRWYEERRAGLGAAFERAVEAALERVRRMPQSGAEVAPPFRRMIVRRFPYDVYFEFDERRILVVLLFHNSRDPAVALSRLGKH